MPDLAWWRAGTKSDPVGRQLPYGSGARIARLCLQWFRSVVVVGWPLAVAVPLAPAQEAPNGGLRVYLDCDRCDDSRIRTDVNFVDYVRDRELADVHVFVTTNYTVFDGRQYEFSFIGRGRHSRSTLTLERLIAPNTPSETAREIISEALRLGLAPFLDQARLEEDFSITYTGGREFSADEQLAGDPWRHWVFEIYGGDFELDLESNRTIFDSRWGVYADHRSEIWKIRFRPYFNYDLVRIKREGRETIRSSISRHGLESYVIRSLGPHWSLGLFGTYLTRNDRNIRNMYSLVPGVEFSLLPYEVATRRAITLVYTLGASYVQYHEETIFNKTEEWRPRHEVDATIAIRRPWGDIYSGIEGSQYLHDRSKQRAEIFGNVSVRLFEGFSLQVEGQFEMIRDQLSLPLGDASLQLSLIHI